jgi:hypothetical protein
VVCQRAGVVCDVALFRAQDFVVDLEPFPFRSNRNGALDCCFDAFSSREPVSTPDQVWGRLTLENAPDIEIQPRQMLTSR